jgi:hypothetical protein
VKVAGVKRQGKGLVASVNCGGLPRGGVVEASIEAGGKVRQKVMGVVPDTGALDMKFRAPLLGWEPGTYRIVFRQNGKVVGTSKIDVK